MKGSITNTDFVCLFVFPNLESQKNLGGEVSREPCLEVCTPELDLVVWGCVQLKVEIPHRWRSATSLGPVPQLCHSGGQEVLPDVQTEVALLQLGPRVSCLFPWTSQKRLSLLCLFLCRQEGRRRKTWRQLKRVTISHMQI